MSKAKTLSLALFTGLVCIVLFSDRSMALSRKTARVLTEKVRIQGADGSAVIVLYDNPTSRDFVSLLPIPVTFRDYAGEEKIAYPPRKLATQGSLSGGEVEGDFTYYVPWGNLAVFYKGFGKDQGLRILGRIESGKEWLGGQAMDFTARIEIIE